MEKGYKETKITDIAKAAGVSPATIYLYFDGKKDLFDSLGIPEVKNLHPELDNKRNTIFTGSFTIIWRKGI